MTQSIAGRYLLGDELASGGMATVHVGRLVGAAGFSRPVAIKRLHPQYSKEEEFVAMFIDEARIAARIRHPNVVATLDTVSENGELFLVMELVVGETLARLMRRSAGPPATMVPPEVAVAVLRDALHGLHAAHEARGEQGEWLEVVHRDISPQNILVGADGLGRVLDFGVAKALGRLHTTHDGQIRGKVAYMAPEQLRGRAVDRRTDVYSAAVVLWEVLTGRRLFVSSTPGETMARVLEQPVDPPSQHARDVPPALDDVVMRGLRRDPRERFETADEMALALEAAVTPAPVRAVARWVEELAGERVAQLARVDVPARQDEPAGSLAVTSATIVDPPRFPRRRWPLLASASAVLVLLGSAIALVGARGAAPATTTEAPVVASAAASSAAPPIASSLPPPAVALPSVTASASAPIAPSATAAPPAAPRKKPATPKKPNCDPPYTIDADGVHIPKKGCH